MLSNNTFCFYADATLENNIDRIIVEGGGNTYITSGEGGNLLSNVTLEYNTFQGMLGTVVYNSDQHASFILGAYSSVKHNYFNATSTFNSGHSINAPEMEIDEFQQNGTSNISYNKFCGLSSDTVAIAFIPKPKFSSFGTENLYANKYMGSNSSYQVISGQFYTINAINKTNYPILSLNGTVRMVGGAYPSGYTANSYSISNVNYYYNVTIKETGLPVNTTWSFVFNTMHYSVSGPSDIITAINGTYMLHANSADYEYPEYKTIIDVAGHNVSETVKYSLDDYGIFNNTPMLGYWINDSLSRGNFSYGGYNFSEIIFNQTAIYINATSVDAPAVILSFKVSPGLYNILMTNGNTTKIINTTSSRNGYINVTYNPAKMPLDPTFSVSRVNSAVAPSPPPSPPGGPISVITHPAKYPLQEILAILLWVVIIAVVTIAVIFIARKH